MKIQFEKNIKEKQVLDIAQKMLVAGRTAPKARGIDNLEIALVEPEGIKEISNEMIKMVENKNAPEFFQRDAQNILQAQCLVIIGTKISPLGLDCKLCGFESCKAKKENNPCIFNTGDLGIAIGSMVSLASDNRIDNRVMYSVGQACVQMKLLGEDVKIAYGIPLSANSKNQFFDRK
ncbi:MAG: ferredoxin [Parcubacteria group bacterium]|nr:ferredoxin [Parcubacteria group bacterium]